MADQLSIVDSQPLPPLAIVKSDPLPGDQPGFVHGAVKGSSLLSMLAHPIDTFTQMTGIDDAKAAKEAWDKGDKFTAAAKALQAITSNPGTRAAASLGDASKDQASKAVSAFHKGDYSGSLLHAATAALPIFAPAANGADLVNQGVKEVTQAPGYDKQPVEDRFAAVLNHPKVREGLGNVAGNAFDVLAAPAAEEALGAVKGAAVKAGVPEALQASAEAQYGRVLNATTKGNKARAARIIPELIDRGVKATSLKSLGDTAADNMEQAGKTLDQTYSSLPPDAGIPVQGLVDRMKAAAIEDSTVLDKNGKPTAPSPAHEKAAEHVDQIAERLDNFAVPDPTTGELKIPIEKARQLRQLFDDVSRQAGRFEGGNINDQSIAAAHGIAGDAIRQEIGQQFPEVAGDNAEFQLWSDANRVIGDTLQRRVGQTKGLGRKIARVVGTGAGAVVGSGAGPFGTAAGSVVGGMALDAIENVINGTGLNTLSAQLKSKLAEAIAGGKVGPISYYQKKIQQAQQQAQENAAAAQAPGPVAPPAPAAGQPPPLTGAGSPPPLSDAAPGTPTPPPLPNTAAPAPETTSLTQPAWDARRGSLPPETQAKIPTKYSAANEAMVRRAGYDPSAAPKATASDIPQQPGLSPEERAVEQKFAAQVAVDPKAAIADYRSRFTKPNGTLEINTDNARELSADYSASNAGRTAYGRAVHEPASWLMKKLYADELAKPVPPGMDNTVRFTAGGTGSGKTTGIQAFSEEGQPAQVIYDTNSNNFESAQAKVQAALDAGKKVSIDYVHAEPDVAFDRMLARANRMGRPVPIDSHIDTHLGAPDAIVKLAEHYKDDPRVKIRVIDNNGPKPQLSSVEALKNLDYTGVKEKLYDALEAHHEAGTISPEIYRAVKGAGAGPLEGDGQVHAENAPEPSGSGGPSGEGEPVSGSAPAGAPAAPSETSILIPGTDKSIPAQYRLRELSDVQASHNGMTFQPNRKYGLKNDRDYTQPENQAKVVEGAVPSRFNPRYHVTDNPDATNGPVVVRKSTGDAIGGNGRAMMLQRVYETNPKGAQAYRDMLIQKSDQFGIDPEQVKSMKQPVLVREVDEAHVPDLQNAITDLNKVGTASLRPAEQAIADSRRVSQSTLEDISNRMEAAGPDASLSNILSGESGPQILDKMIDDGVITPQQRAGYVVKDALTKEGKDRVSKLLVGRFFKDPAQIDTIPEAIKAKVERIAAPLASAEGIDGWSITPQVQQALDLIENARAYGTKNLDLFLKQGGLLTDQSYSPEAVDLAKKFQSAQRR